MGYPLILQAVVKKKKQIVNFWQSNNTFIAEFKMNAIMKCEKIFHFSYHNSEKNTGFADFGTCIYVMNSKRKIMHFKISVVRLTNQVRNKNLSFVNFRQINCVFTKLTANTRSIKKREKKSGARKFCFATFSETFPRLSHNSKIKCEKMLYFGNPSCKKS